MRWRRRSSLTHDSAVSISALPATGLARAEAFLRWLTAAIAASLHPGAPHARQQAALELLVTLLDVWDDQATKVTPQPNHRPHACGCPCAAASAS